MNPVAAAAPPAWDTVAHDVLCPLCDYNLRGLTEARCPECGYAFDWPDVLDPKTRVHPYLFEHHPERNARSFVRTLVGTLNPLRFWRSLSPTQPSRPRRMMAYWVLTAALAMLVVVADGVRAVREAWDNSMTSSVVYGWARTRQGQVPVPVWSPPFPNNPPGWRRLFNTASYAWRLDDRLDATFVFTMFWVAWPWMTLAALMIFRASMRRAKVKSAHVVRCVVYTFDVGAWAGPAALVGVIAWALLTPPPNGRNSEWEDYVGYVLLALLAIVTVRLWIAYRTYLRFSHAFWTIFASQLITVLLAGALTEIWLMHLRPFLTGAEL